MRQISMIDIILRMLLFSVNSPTCLKEVLRISSLEQVFVLKYFMSLARDFLPTYNKQITHAVLTRILKANLALPNNLWF